VEFTIAVVGIVIAAISTAVAAVALVLNYFENKHARKILFAEKYTDLIDLVLSKKSLINVARVDGYAEAYIASGWTKYLAELEILQAEAKSIDTELKMLLAANENWIEQQDSVMVQTAITNVKTLTARSEVCLQNFEDWHAKATGGS